MSGDHPGYNRAPVPAILLYNECVMLERRTIRIIKRAMPTVVSIIVSEKLEDFEKNMTPEVMAELPKSKDGKKLAIPEELVDSHGMIEVGGGSGFIVEADGVIVTNKHVVAESYASYAVLTEDGRKFDAEILSRDPINDVAVLKIKAHDLPFLALGDAAKLELGQTVVAIGNALGVFKNTVSRGIVSGLSRSIVAQADPKAPPQEMRGLIQTDAAINPGNSGGPLVDMHGKVIGINAAIVSGAHSIGFAIPINAVKRDLADLKRYGHIRRPLLGVRYIVIDEHLKEKRRLPVGYGAYVTRETPRDHAVAPGSPAALAGITEKDIILECNGTRIDRDHSIQDALEDLNVGDVLMLKVLRGAKEIMVKVPLAERK